MSLLHDRPPANPAGITTPHNATAPTQPPTGHEPDPGRCAS